MNRISANLTIALFCLLIPCFASEKVLPDPLLNSRGAKVLTAESWTKERRAEVLKLFRENVYGRAPVRRPASLGFEVTDTSDAMEGRATRKLVTISYPAGGTGAIHLVLFTPKKSQVPVPCFLLICNRAPENIDPTRKVKSPFWPAELIVERGYAAAAFHNEEVAVDRKDSFQTGVHKLFGSASGRSPDAWGTIAAWAWGASRVMDYLETDESIDPNRVAVVGHSRGGKTALWAGAEDERFGMVVSNDSGSTGAAIARGKAGERIRDINRAFPYWFCENYKRFDDREDELPVDQHMLLALIAPRLLYVASASEDTWADPKSEFAAAVHSAPVYRLFGLEALGTSTFPAPDSPIHIGHVGYHLRTGKHNLTEYDWTQFLNFADKHGWAKRRRE